MTTTNDPLKLAEYLGKPAPLKGCSACGTDSEQTVMLQKHPDGTARWDSFCASCYQHTDLGSADLTDRLARAALLAQPQPAPDALREKERFIDRQVVASMRLSGVEVSEEDVAKARAALGEEVGWG